MPQLDDAEIKQLDQRLTDTSDSRATNPTAGQSLLERFLVCSNEAKIRARAKRNAKVSSVLVKAVDRPRVLTVYLCNA